jgi:hypothetical protein
MLRTGPVKRRRGAIGEERRWEGLSAILNLTVRSSRFRVPVIQAQILRER